MIRGSQQRTYILLIFSMLACTSAALAQCSNPTYQGFGSGVTGGAGQSVVQVTNLNDSGAGSLRSALFGGNRCIQFRVSGSINLSSEIRIEGMNNITIDGMSAPSPGITIREFGLFINSASNIIIRGLRINLEDTPACSAGDGISLEGGAQNIVIDHNSVSHAGDENLGSGWGVEASSNDAKRIKNVTVSWNIFSDPQQCVGDQVNVAMSNWSYRISMHHNIMASGDERLPRHGYQRGEFGGLAPDTSMDLVNNLMYLGPEGQGTKFVEGARANAVNNYYVADPSALLDAVYACVGESGVTPQCYVSGNVAAFPVPGTPLNSRGNLGSRLSAPAITTTSAFDAACAVVGGAGVFPRDSHDQSVISRINLSGCGATPIGQPLPPPVALRIVGQQQGGITK